MYSAVDSFFRRMNFNVFFPLLPSTDALILSLYIFALLDIILPITSQNSNHHMSCGETKLRDTVRNGNSKENVNFLQSAQRAVFFLRGKIRLMSNLRSNEFKCAEASLGESENALNSLQRSSKISVSTYFSSPTIPRYRYIWSVQLLVIFLLVSSQPRVTLRMPRVSIRIH